MCMFQQPQMPQMAAPAPAPTKSDAQIQSESETERLRLGFSTHGIASTLLTGGLGDLTAANVSGLRLGGF